MTIQILTPEEIIFNGEVEAISVPGVNGSFQILKDHVAIVSALVKGNLKLTLSSSVSYDATFNQKMIKEGNQLNLEIKGGMLEFNHNKAIVLLD